jgi:formyltetrahydrofolate-dependent phosphoribosylglycinamide formyltransferase
MLKIAVFASGKGSNFKAILDSIKNGTIHNARVVVVISNNADAGAFRIAQENGIPTAHMNRKLFETDDAYTEAVLAMLKRHGVNFIVLAGYMKKIGSTIIAAYRNRILNIHPALLPAFGGKGMYGMFVHQAVIASKMKTSGATVHVVDEEYDRGPIVLQKSVEVSDNDTPETLAAKVLTIEHELYPEAIRLFAEGCVTIHNRTVTKSNR